MSNRSRFNPITRDQTYNSIIEPGQINNEKGSINNDLGTENNTDSDLNDVIQPQPAKLGQGKFVSSRRPYQRAKINNQEKEGQVRFRRPAFAKAGNFNIDPDPDQ